MIRLIVAILPFILITNFAFARDTVRSGGSKQGTRKAKQMKMVPLDSVNTTNEIGRSIKEQLPGCAEKILGSGENCKIQDMGQIGDPEHRKKRSCHNLTPPEAWDIGKIQCGNVMIDPKKDKQKYLNLIECVVKKDNLTAIFSEKGANVRRADKHDDHGHYELKGCYAKLGGKSKKKSAMIDLIEDTIAFLTNELVFIRESIAETNERALPEDFDKVIEATGVGKLRLEYRDIGEPVVSPAHLDVFIKCDGSKEEILVANVKMCEIRTYNYQKEDKILKVAHISGEVENSAVLCDIDDETEINVADACKNYWREKLPVGK